MSRLRDSCSWEHFAEMVADWSTFLASPQDLTMLKLLRFKELPEGWHFSQGVPANSNCLKQAISLYHTGTEEFGFTRSDCFPGIEGEVMVTFYEGDYCLEFTFEIDGSITFSLEQGCAALKESSLSNLEVAMGEMCDFRKGQWKSYEYSTLSTMTQPEGASFVLHSATQAEEGGYPLFADSA